MTISVSTDEAAVSRIKATGVTNHDALLGTLNKHVFANHLFAAALNTVWENIVVPEKSTDRHVLAVLVAISDPNGLDRGVRLFTVGFGPDNNTFDLTPADTTKKLWAFKKNTYQFDKKNIIFTPILDIVARAWEVVGNSILTDQDPVDDVSDLLANVYKGHKCLVVLLQKSVEGDYVHFRGIADVQKNDIIVPEAKTE